MCTHVDDFWIAGAPDFLREIVETLRATFSVGSVDELPHTNLGVNIRNCPNGFNIDLSSYMPSIRQIPLMTKRIGKKDEQTNESEKGEIRSLLGKFLWPATQSRPDISYSVSNMSETIHKSKVSDIISLNKVVRRLHSEMVSALNFPNLGEIANWFLLCYSDASFKNTEDGQTHAGYLIFLTNKTTRRCSLIAWKSGLLRRVARSTLAAETFACINCIDQAIGCQKILYDISRHQVPIIAVSDNASWVETIYSVNPVSDKRLRVDIAYLRSTITDGYVQKVRWIDTAGQLADCMTKPRSVSTNKLITALKTSSLSSIWRREC